jgi:hypothetical protein
MSCSPKVTLLLISCVLSAVLIAPRPASAQSDRSGPAQPERADTTWAALDVTRAITNAIDESKEGDELRERLVRRFSECSLMYGGLSTLTTNVEARKSYVQAQEATMEIEGTIAKPLTREKRLELEETARRSVAFLLRTVKAQGNKEIAPLLKNCKELNDLNEIKTGLRELPKQ